MARDERQSNDDGLAGMEGRAPSRATATTPERLWHEHGEALRALARRELGDDPARIEVACYRTMLRAAETLADGAPRRGWASWPWLKEIAAAVCDDVRHRGFSPDEVPVVPLPEALPYALRLRCFLRVDEERSLRALDASGAEHPAGEAIVRRRRMWRGEWARRRLRDAPVVVLLPRQWWRVCERSMRSPREWCRRAEIHVVPSASSPHGMASFLAAAPAVSEMAVAVTAALAFGVGAGAAAAAPPVILDDPPAVATTRAVPTRAFGTDGPQSPVSPADDAENRPPVVAERYETTSEPSESAAFDAAAAPTPAVTTETDSAAEPVASTSYERNYNYDAPGRSYETPSTRVTLDVDDDDNPEADVGTPYLFVDCPESDHGSVTGTTCSTLDSSGVGE